MRFLPQVSYYINRERTDIFRSKHNEKVKLIMNAWWMHEVDHFPPSDCIDPLFVSFHLRYDRRDRTFLSPKVKKYLNEHGPVGCRDTGTMEFLSFQGINAFFSGCLTTTLLPNQTIKGRFMTDYILCVDVPEEVVEKVKTRTTKQVFDISRMLTPAMTFENRMKAAKFFLFLYHNAFCVITPRLHVALPAVSFGTPVCMLKGGNLIRKKRFDGLEDLFNEVDIDQFQGSEDVYDINHLPKNPVKILNMRDELVRICSAFTHYDSQKSVFEDDYNPLIEMADALKYDSRVISKTVLFEKTSNLGKTLIRRIFHGTNRFDSEV